MYRVFKRFIVALIGSVLCLPGYCQVTDSDFFGEAKYKWVKTRWSKNPDPYAALGHSIKFEVKRLGLASEYRSIVEHAESAFDTWNRSPSSDKNLFIASLWYLESSRYTLALMKPGKIENYGKLIRAWTSAGDPDSVEFSRLGYLLRATHTMGVSLVRLGNALFKRFPNDLDVIKVFAHESFLNKRESSIIREASERLDLFVAKYPKDTELLIAQSYSHFGLVYEKDRNAQLIVAYRSLLLYFEKRRQTRISESDRAYKDFIEQVIKRKVKKDPELKKAIDALKKLTGSFLVDASVSVSKTRQEHF